MTPGEETRLSDRDLLIEIKANLTMLIADKKDHEERLRKQAEQITATNTEVSEVRAIAEKAVTPKALWGGFVSVAGAVATLTAVIGWVLNR